MKDEAVQSKYRTKCQGLVFLAGGLACEGSTGEIIALVWQGANGIL